MPSPAQQSLERLAAEAAVRVGLGVSLITPKDSAVTWKAAAVHPLQGLETSYQTLVYDAVQGVEDADARMAIEGETLGGFFFFDANTPRLLGVGQGRPYAGRAHPLAEDQICEARRRLKAAILALGRTHLEVDGAALRADLHAALSQATAVRDAFWRLPGSPWWNAPAVSEAARLLDGLGPVIDTTHAISTFELICARLRTVLDLLDEAVAGVASVQMLYMIEPFYLFRLLVRFRVESDQRLSKDAVARTSAVLTDLLTNGHPWLSDWLRDKMVDLADRIRSADPSGDTLFFLKGGRAIAYLQDTPGEGKNDWDTQIVINPDLAPAAWYALFLKMSNLVLLALKDYKLDLYMLLNHRAADFQTELAQVATGMDVDEVALRADDMDVIDGMEIDDPAADPMEIDADDDPPGPNRANCKGELIDVGLPRYDTVEAREQWLQLRNNILLAADGVPYPGHLYYIDEYIMMIRAAFAGSTLGLAKVAKRIERLYSVLGMRAVGAVVAQERSHIPPQTLPLSVAAVERQADIPTRSAYIVLLRQFAQAYGFAVDPGLAGAFDAAFVAGLPINAQPPYPTALSDAIAAQIRANTWPPALTSLTDAIGYAQQVSSEMGSHILARAEFVQGRWPVLSSFLRNLCGQDGLSQATGQGIRIAIRGALAAAMHADYVGYDKAELEPPAMVAAGFYVPAAREADALTTLDTLVRRALAATAGAGADFDLRIDAQLGALRLYWREPLPGTFVYAALAVEIVVRVAVQPVLSFIWGFPVLSLRDLVRDYRRRAADTAELGLRTRLRRTISALTDMARRDGHALPPNPALAALRGAACSHLRIRSDSLATPPGGVYPASYYPSAAFEITLGDNRAALRQALTLGDATPRLLDLLVVNQGEGGLGVFGGWSGDELQANLVAPLATSGVRARLIVLDFRLSASLLGVFKPLCVQGGSIVSTLYGAPDRIMTTGCWLTLEPALQLRDGARIAAGLQARLQRVSAELTGRTHLADVMDASERQVSVHLANFPNDRDAISMTRYLPRIASALQTAGANPALAYAGFAEVRASGNLGRGETAILAGLPWTQSLFNPDLCNAVEAQLKARLTAILTDPLYGVGALVGARPLFGASGSLWSLLLAQRDWLLSRAAGLTRRPTAFSVYDQASNQLRLDTALVGASAEVQQALRRLDPSAPEDLAAIIALLVDRGAVAGLDRIANYLQPST